MMSTTSRKLSLGGMVAFAMALLSSPAMAHHSAAMFDDGVCRTLQGTVYKFAMNYPHARIWLNVAKPDGSAETWAFEGADPATLRVAGWTLDALKVGEKVTIVFNPLRDGRNGGRFRDVTLPDGRVMKLGYGKGCPASNRPVKGG